MSNYKIDLALTSYQQGRYDVAIEQLRDILSHDPEDAFAHGILSTCLMAKSRIYAAEHEIMIALQINSHVPYFFLVKARIKTFQNNFKEAFELCQEALRLDPNFYDAHLVMSDIASQLGRRQKALEHLKKATSLAPENINIMVAFGEYYLRQGEKEKAESYARESLALHAQSEDANILMGKIKLARGEVVDAEYHAKFAISQNPSSQRALRLFSDIKLHSNIFLGFWWRFNSWAATLSHINGALVLIGAFLFFNLISQILFDLKFSTLSNIISYVWLGLALYSWIGIPMYYRALKKELNKFSFNPDF